MICILLVVHLTVAFAAIQINPDGTVTGSVDMSQLKRVLNERGKSIDIEYEKEEEEEEEAIVKIGSEGDIVKEIQQKLIDIGIAKGKASGKYGNGIAAAVKVFQKMVGLDSTGIIDSETYDALINYDDVYMNNNNEEQVEAEKKNSSEELTDPIVQVTDIAVSYKDIESDYPIHYLVITVTLPTGEEGKCYSEYYDFTPEISSYADAHEEYKYKKIPIEYQQGKETIYKENEILYKGKVHYTLANDHDV